MSDSNEPKSWRDIIEKQRVIETDGYVLYLRRSKAPKNNKDKNKEPTGEIDKLTLKEQGEACEHFADRHELKIVKIFQEEHPAKNPNERIEFKKMLKYIEDSDKNLGILAWDPARISRNALEAGIVIQMHLEKTITDFKFVTFHFTQDESGIEYLMMEFARAMGYSLRLSRTVSRSMQSKYHEDGEWQFPNKFGYTRLMVTTKNGGRGTINFQVPHEPKDGKKGEFEALQVAFKMRIRGKTLKEIANYINNSEFVNKGGEKLKMSSSKLSSRGVGKKGYLKDTFYKGIMEMEWGPSDLRDKTCKDDDGNVLGFVPVVTETEFDLCQEVNKREGRVVTAQHDYVPFRSMVKCGHCNETMTPEVKSKKGEKYVYYYCHNGACNGGKMHAQSKNRRAKSGITGNSLFDEIGNILQKTFKLTKKDFTIYLLHLEKAQQLRLSLKRSDLKSIQAQKGHIEAKKKENEKDLFQAMAKVKTAEQAEVLTRAYEAKKAELDKRLKELLEQERRILEGNTPWTQNFKKWLELTKEVYLYWKKAELPEKQRLAENIFLELEVKDGKLASYKYNEPYLSCQKSNSYLHGGR